MKTYSQNLLFLPVFALIAWSCDKDKGNYDYRDVREAHIEIPLVDQYDGELSYDWFYTMMLEPEVTTADGRAVTDSEYEFEWYIYQRTPVELEDGTYPPKKKIGQERNLSYYLEDIPGNYNVALTAANKHTGAVTDYRFPLTIQAINGWMVLDGDAQGNMDLHMIQDNDLIPGLQDEQVGIEHDLYATANEGAKLEGVKFLGQINNNWGTYYSVYAYTDDGFYKIDPRSFTLKTDNYSSMFSVQPAVYAPQVQYAYHPYAGRLEVMLNDGAFYYIRWNMMGQRDIYGSPATGAFSVIYKFAPFLAPIPWGDQIVNVLYNDTYSANKSFVTVDQFGGVNFVTTTAGAFDTGNIDYDFSTGAKPYDFTPVYIGSGTSGMTCGVFADRAADGKLWLLAADFRDPESPLAVLRKSIDDLPSIRQATHFVFGSRGDVMFYATPNGIYSYLYRSEGARPQLLLPLSGEQTGSMKLYEHYANETYTGRILMVGVNDGYSGTVYKIPFNELSGALAEGGVKVFTGFNRIVDMDIKE